MTGIHRLVEANAAVHPDATAIIDGDRRCCYRELNATANVLARRLMALGLRRRFRAYVRMKPSIDLATTLLAIVKVGASYTVVTDDSAEAPSAEGISFCAGEGAAIQQLGIVPVEPVTCSPNLPVITRPTDIACVLEHGAGALSVPHATIASLKSHAVTQHTRWTNGQGSFDLWIALMNGATAVVDERAAAAA